MKKIFWTCTENGTFELHWEGKRILQAYAQAFHVDGRRMDSRYSRLTDKVEEGGRLKLTFERDDDLILTEELEVLENHVPVAKVSLSSSEGKGVETRCLVPLVVQEAPETNEKLWKSLWSKMLLVPYDNTMWLRYEAVPLRAGRKSYDLTVLFQEDTREGLLIGAIDFDFWKNGLICSAYDAKSICAVSGLADEGSHDTEEHGSLAGKKVSSSRFVVLYGTDYRELLEKYGDLVAEETRPLEWNEGVPFGFNSWAGLAFRLNADNYQKTGKFLREELAPKGYENKGVTYVNLDACWNTIPEEVLTARVKELHENDQRAGIYDAPFAFFGKEPDAEIPGIAGHCFNEILLRDSKGRLLPRVDGAIPYDVTHPLWKEYTRRKFNDFVKWDFDYVKVDFMSHGGMEGVHYDSSVRTGRQALNAAYQFIDELLKPEKTGKPFFISLSIAPLFPNGYGHARRFSCDAFGTAEDVEYVLNAQTYAWWQNHRLYAFNDPDHSCLLKSFCMDRDSSLGEARARYTASVIAGTVMMLSDDYEREEAKERSRILTGNPEVNKVAASRVAFRPTEAGGTSASHCFTAVIDGKQYIAMFSWETGERIVELDPLRAGLKAGVSYRELWSGKTVQEKNGQISWNIKDCDAALFKEE